MVKSGIKPDCHCKLYMSRFTAITEELINVKICKSFGVLDHPTALGCNDCLILQSPMMTMTAGLDWIG